MAKESTHQFQWTKTCSEFENCTHFTWARGKLTVIWCLVYFLNIQSSTKSFAIYWFLQLKQNPERVEDTFFSSSTLHTFIDRLEKRWKQLLSIVKSDNNECIAARKKDIHLNWNVLWIQMCSLSCLVFSFYRSLFKSLRMTRILDQKTRSKKRLFDCHCSKCVCVCACASVFSLSRLNCWIRNKSGKKFLSENPTKNVCCNR